MVAFFDRLDPSLREQIAAIDWQSEQVRDGARGAIFAELETQREQASKAGLTPYYLRAMKNSPLAAAHAPYNVRPVWNQERRMLELAFLSAKNGLAADAPELARYALPPHIYAKALQHHRESIVESLKAQFSGVAPGGVVRARAVGGECIRDFLREHNLVISLSFASALFGAITRLNADS